MDVVPLGGRSPETPVIVTRAAPVVAHESVTCCGAQPEEGATSKLVTTGAVENAKAYLEQLQNGSRPEEIQQAQHNLEEARATAANDKITLDRTRDLVSKCGRVSSH